MGYEKRQIIHDIIENAMETKDRYVSLYFGKESMSVNVYPLIKDELIQKAYDALVKDEDVNAAIGYLGEALE